MDLFHHKLLTEGVQTEGVILEWHTGPTVSTTRLVVGFQPEGGERVEFSQSITDYVEAPAASLREHFDRDVIPLSLLEGERIPVRYRADKPSHAVIDEPELHRRAIEGHQQAQADSRQRAEEQLEHRPEDETAVLVAPLEGAGDSEGAKINQLEQLAELHAKGALTDEEFAAAKRNLLAE
jgi:putative oligomerization/nucleic acid binding protein/uncharacterized protein DUF3592